MIPNLRPNFVLALAAWILAPFAVAAHESEPLPQRHPVSKPIPPGESVGCYWIRGRQYCGHYCYWEVNGRRYCQKRWERATPQGAYIEEYPLEERRSTYYRRPYFKVRPYRPRR